MATYINKVRLNHRADTDDETNGHIRYEQVKFDCTTGNDNTWTQSWSYPIDVLSGEMFGVANPDGTEADVTGDEFSSWVELTVGAVTVAGAVNDTVISVSSTVTDNMHVGDCVQFAGHTNIYSVDAVDSGAGTITIGTGLTTAVAVSESVVLVRYFIGVADNPIILGPIIRSHVWGDDTPDSTRVPVGATFKIKYKNNQGANDKTIYGQLAYLY